MLHKSITKHVRTLTIPTKQVVVTTQIGELGWLRVLENVRFKYILAKTDSPPWRLITYPDRRTVLSLRGSPVVFLRDSIMSLASEIVASHLFQCSLLQLKSGSLPVIFTAKGRDKGVMKLNYKAAK